MAIMPGARIGGYEVLSLLGAGGMGEVYRARDTKLNRDVALKILPESFALDADRLARFRREAQVLASLNHPNIAAIYGFEESNATQALVLELVEGPTLADRIARGPILLDEALPIAKQVAKALEAAHEQGIIHRDLKPANVKLRPDGTIKLLDFGLAKALATDPLTSPATLMNSPTITSPVGVTGIGVLLGTAAYMSPEQAKGRNADKRSDVWAFGCVLYEMLVGKRAFEGDDVSDTLAAVLREAPDWSVLERAVPAPIVALVKRCLDKDRGQRVADISVVRYVLDDASLGHVTSPKQTPHGRRTGILVVAAAALAAGLVISAVSIDRALRDDAAADRSIARFPISLPDGQNWGSAGAHNLVISPDGKRIAYVANGALYFRVVDQLEPVMVRDAGTGVSEPFFSPDGQWIAFFQAGQLKKVAVAGGSPLILCRATAPLGASWTSNNTIVFGQYPAGIVRVSADGGTPEELVKVPPEQTAYGPQMLPGGRAVLYTLKEGGRLGLWNEAQVIVHDLESGARTVVIQEGTDARYLPTGHLLFNRQLTLFAVPFDVTGLKALGSPVALLNDVRSGGAGNFPAAQISTSLDGTMVYAPPGSSARRTLAWIDRDGSEETLPIEPKAYSTARISPDGSRVVMDERLAVLAGEGESWVWNMQTATLSRATFEAGNDINPLWTPDGRHLIVANDGDGTVNLFRRPADGTGSPERLTESPSGQVPLAISKDGRLVFRTLNLKTGENDIHMLQLTGNRHERPLITTPFDEGDAAISPDARSIAYVSNATGRDEVYVRPFPNVDEGLWQISNGGGTQPLWSRDGRELFFRSAGCQDMMAVNVQTSPTFTYSAPKRLFPSSGIFCGGGRASYDVAPDGKRFLMIKDAASDPARFVIVQNWFTELQRRVPAR
jgi:serine/threonine-protein kinase